MQSRWASLLESLVLVLAVSQGFSQKSLAEPLKKDWDTFLAQEMNALLRIRSSVESFDENGPMASWKADETAGESQVIPTRITERE